MTLRPPAATLALVLALATGAEAQVSRRAKAKAAADPKAATPASANPTPDPAPTVGKDGEKDKDKDKAPAKEGEDAKKDLPKVAKIEKATFGGGCFWSIEAVFERLPGVKSVTSGFSGGGVPSPSYQMVCTGQTGHAEVVQIEYDSSIIPYEKLLAVFWKAHDPTTPNAQGDDFGPQYRSAIFYHDEAQRKAALKSAQDLKARRAVRGPIVTELLPFKAFYPAEPYHQDYYRNHLGEFYSQVYIEPKLRKLKLMR